MRIAQLMAGAAQGGAELFYERMTIALAQAGNEVLPVIRAEPGRLERLRQAGLAPVTARYGGLLDVRSKSAIAVALRDFRSQIAIAWMSRAAMFAPQGDWTLVGRLGGYYDLKYFRHCDHLVGNTRGIVRWIAGQGWPAAQVHYWPNFVDDFATTPAASRMSLGVPDAVPLVLALGRLHAVKGFDVLIRAMAQVPEAHAVIAGAGPERAALERLVGACGLRDRVHLPGWRGDAGALLKAADVFVSSSRHEPLGNMVLEAFSARTPVVAAAAEGPSEVIKDGQDGLLVPIDDPQALAGAIRAVLQDRHRGAVLATAGRARFEAEFERSAVLRIWQNALNGLVR
jgi:glycosyltransferase involved in cell wall biosynthesis